MGSWVPFRDNALKSCTVAVEGHCRWAGSYLLTPAWVCFVLFYSFWTSVMISKCKLNNLPIFSFSVSFKVIGFFYTANELTGTASQKNLEISWSDPAKSLYLSHRTMGANSFKSMRY